MSKLEFIHDQFLFDNLPVEKLTPNRLGDMIDYINDMPDEEELEELKTASNKLEDLLNDIKNEIETYRKSFNDLINDPEVDKKDMLTDFIEFLTDLKIEYE